MIGIDQLSADPLVRAVAQGIRKATANWCVQSAENALGLKRLYALLLLLGRIPIHNLNLHWETGSGQTSEEVLADVILAAPVILLAGHEASDMLQAMSEKIQLARKQAAAAGIRLTPTKLPFPTLFLVYAHLGSDNGRLLMTQETQAVSIHYEQDGFKTYWLDGVAEEALAVLLTEKILVQAHESPNRQFRKTARQLGLPADEKIRVLRLRPVQRLGSLEGTLKGSHQYHCQWLVRGHLRNQWFPSTNTHRLIWVDPHKKGPEGLPFRETVRVVVR